MSMTQGVKKARLAKKKKNTTMPQLFVYFARPWTFAAVLSGLVLLLAGSCRSLPPGPAATLQEGLFRWQENEQAKSGTYFYWQTQSYMSGHYEITGIQIENKRPVARYYKTFQRNGRKISSLQSWTEEAAKLESHKDGAPAQNMEQLYAKCKDLLRSRGSNEWQLLVKTDSNGVLRSCHAIRKDCRDDCSDGFEVSGIVYRKLSEKEVRLFLTKPFAKL